MECPNPLGFSYAKYGLQLGVVGGKKIELKNVFFFSKYFLNIFWHFSEQNCNHLLFGPRHAKENRVNPYLDGQTASL